MARKGWVSEHEQDEGKEPATKRLYFIFTGVFIPIRRWIAVVLSSVSRPKFSRRKKKWFSAFFINFVLVGKNPLVQNIPSATAFLLINSKKEKLLVLRNPLVQLHCNYYKCNIVSKSKQMGFYNRFPDRLCLLAFSDKL